MKNHKKPVLMLLAICAAAIIAVAVSPLHNQVQDKKNNLPDSEQQKIEFESQFPLVDYTMPESSDPKEHAKAKKYDKSPIEIDESSDNITSSQHWANGLSALPVDRSDAVVLGEVIDAQAHLSNDKTGVYSEFTIRVDKVFKNDKIVSLISGSSVIAERSGGRVRFPSGHITLSNINGQGMPRVGQHYALFLTHAFPLMKDQTEEFYLLTGYELKAGRILPLDNPGSGTHPISKVYKDASDSIFLNDLRSAISNP